MNYENCEGTKVFLLFSNIKSENGARRKNTAYHIDITDTKKKKNKKKQDRGRQKMILRYTARWAKSYRGK